MKKLIFIIVVGSLFIGCEEDNPEGCCYYSLGENNNRWGCIEDSFKLSCEQVENSQHLVATSCISIGYCQEYTCEIMGCIWEEGTITEWCTCN